MEPNVGEYWWARTYFIICPYSLVKIIDITDNTVTCRVLNTGKIIRIDEDLIEIKWEPNFFWKCLGYK